ncbi:hypothetical protein [Gemmobacter sp.]|uniref:hypothetical protein n=1 Tax=Gemmobacter sp. TaxID=1898957 RepID=UPI002AFF0EDC|nr:hypothetical protein [Gemmobacter sp.]
MALSGPAGVRVLLAAAQAHPVLEPAFLAAQSRISAGFRIFDLRTAPHARQAQRLAARGSIR